MPQCASSRRGWPLRWAAVVGVVASLLALPTLAGAQDAEEPAIPPEAEKIELPEGGFLEGWEAVGPASVYVAETLPDRMPQIASRLLGYAFQVAYVRRYAKDDSEIAAVAACFASSGEAWGAWSVQPRNHPVPLGQGANFAEGRLTIWKGRWFLEVGAPALELLTPEGLETAEAIAALGEAIVNALHRLGEPPAELALLPEANRREGTEAFFHEGRLLREAYPLDECDALGLGEDTNAVMAEYAGAGTRSLRVVVEYPDAGGAQAAFAALLKARYKRAEPPADGRYVGKGQWPEQHEGAAVHERFLVLCLDAESQEAAGDVLEATVAHVAQQPAAEPGTPEG